MTINGFLLIDKPQGMTSFGVVGRVRKLLAVRKAGHCGTLDPLATGLLIVCLGKATKLARFVLGSRKSYQAAITLGATTDTYDREGTVQPGKSDIIPTSDEIKQALKGFVGRIKQTPPIYSALKVNGKPLYKYAREEAEVAVEPREVVIESIELTEYSYPTLKLSVTCGSGTYIRSLAHDLGQQLGCGGFIEELRRERVGDTSVESAISLEELERVVTRCKTKAEVPSAIGRAFVELEDMITLPAITVEDGKRSQVEHGVPLCAEDISQPADELAANQLVALRASSGDLLAIGRTLCRSAELSQLGSERVIEYVRVI